MADSVRPEEVLEDLCDIKRSHKTINIFETEGKLHC